ncbi:trans-Golgi network integral membrane protein 2-like [Procambarus clarkii]|uniref:trans-Golgi network integral membrane protein 2-like n=1 Tax=Procambarus clarkii TaxID=6728 RepID=UPI0037439F30
MKAEVADEEDAGEEETVSIQPVEDIDVGIAWLFDEGATQENGVSVRSKVKMTQPKKTRVKRADLSRVQPTEIKSRKVNATVLSRSEEGSFDDKRNLISPSESLAYGHPDIPGREVQVEKEQVEEQQKPTAGSVEKPTAGSVEKPTAGSVEKPTAGSVEKPTAGSVQKPTAGSVEKPTAGSVEKPTAGSVEKPTAGSVEKPTAGSVEKPTAGSVEKPTAGSVQKPTAGSVEKPTAGSVEKPTAGSVQKPTAGSVEKPTAGSVEKPTAGSVEKPTAGSANLTNDSELCHQASPKTERYELRGKATEAKPHIPGKQKSMESDDNHQQNSQGNREGGQRQTLKDKKQPMLNLDDNGMDSIKGPESHEGTTRVNDNHKGGLTTRKQETESMEQDQDHDPDQT